MLEIPGILDRSFPRRRFLQISGYSAVASLLNQSALGASTSSAVNPIQSCILVMLYGGPSHFHTWARKPRAPREIRGEYQPIQTTCRGVLSASICRIALV